MVHDLARAAPPASSTAWPRCQGCSYALTAVVDGTSRLVCLHVPCRQRQQAAQRRRSLWPQPVAAR